MDVQEYLRPHQLGKDGREDEKVRHVIDMDRAIVPPEMKKSGFDETAEKEL